VADLLDRILGNLTTAESGLGISLEIIVAAMREVNRGELTQAQVKNALSLTNADAAGFLSVYNQIFTSGTLTLEELRDVLVLGETRNRADLAGAPYYNKALVKSRLGL